MKYQSFLPENVQFALRNEPPGSWMPILPKECIRLSAGYPAPALIPSKEVQEAVACLIKEEGDLPFHYIGSEKIASLQKQIQNRLNQRGIKIQKEELLMTSGACQAIDLISRTLLDEKAWIVVESPTYMEALEMFKNYTSNILEIQIDEQGLNTKQLEELLKDRKRAGLPMPCLVYTIPTFHNPTGTTMSLERRQHLLELSVEFNFLIVEDDAYGELAFNERITPCKAMDTEGRVLYVGSLSKVVAPGMRIGWIAGAKELITTFSWFKKDLDHPFAQATTAVYIDNVNFEKRMEMLRRAYRVRCEIMIRALEEFLPESVTWYVPKGGFFVWVKVLGVDTFCLLDQALNQGVSFVPGKFFFCNPEEGREYLRFSFSYVDEEEMVRGIEIIGHLLKEGCSIS